MIGSNSISTVRRSYEEPLILCKESHEIFENNSTKSPSLGNFPYKDPSVNPWASDYGHLINLIMGLNKLPFFSGILGDERLPKF